MIQIGLIQKALNKIIPKPWGYNPAYSSYVVDYEKFVKGAYENPFIQAPFVEFLTDLKALEFGVYTKKGKDFKRSETQGAKFVERSLKRPNKELGFKQMLEAITTYTLFGGRCLLYKTKGGVDCDIYVYNPNTFEIRRNDNSLEIDSIRLGDTEVTGKDLTYYHVIKNFDPNDTIAGFGNGYSKIKPLAMVGDMLNYLLIHNNSLLKNGGRISGVLRIGKSVNPKTLKELYEKFKANYTGAKEAGTVALVEAERDQVGFDPMATNPKDLDWIEGMKELQKIICRVLGIPEALIMADNSSYNNLEGFKKKIYQDTIIPFAEFICEELTEFFKDDLEDGEEIWFSTSKIKALQNTTADEIKKYGEALQGKISTNDFIKFINDSFEMDIPLLPKDVGDQVLVSTNMMFLKDLGVSYEPQTSPDDSEQV